MYFVLGELAEDGQKPETTEGRYLSYLWCRGVLVLDDLLPQLLHLSDASLQSSSRLDLILLAVQPQGIFGEGRVGARGGGTPEVVLVESDGERGVGGQDELGITLAPVPRGSRT